MTLSAIIEGSLPGCGDRREGASDSYGAGVQAKLPRGGETEPSFKKR